MYYLVAGVIAVVVVGRLLAFSGKRYLAGPGLSARERESAGSVATLVSMLFHLVTLGLTALLAAIPFGGTMTQAFLVRIGLLLILVAVAYSIALRMLTRRKTEAVVSDFDAQVRELRQDSARSHPNEYAVTNDPSAGMAPQAKPEPTLGEPRRRV
jgi:preprotein translocase subunit SecG